jgi:hypothetical protein
MNSVLPQLLVSLGIVICIGVPILTMVGLFQREETQRREVGRCGFVE